MSLPKHLAIIMDGNGRWARSRFLPRIEGHRRGVLTVRAVVEQCRRLGIENLSLFAFSSENWNRPADEVSDRTAFDATLTRAIDQAEAKTAGCTDMHLNVCINYGGRWDIAQAAQSAANAHLPLTIEAIDRFLSMSWSGPVDLMIRTGGEQRISNFILWQAAYAELWFTEKLWPEFDAKDLDEALAWFAGRERRFGKTSEQIRSGA